MFACISTQAGNCCLYLACLLFWMTQDNTQECNIAAYLGENSAGKGMLPSLPYDLDDILEDSRMPGACGLADLVNCRCLRASSALAFPSVIAAIARKFNWQARLECLRALSGMRVVWCSVARISRS